MWKNIAGLHSKYAKRFESGLTRWPSRELGERVLGMLASAKEPEPSLELDVPAAALTGTRYWFEFNKGDKSRWPDWIARWTSLDLGFALRALFACTLLDHDDEDDALFIHACTVDEGLSRLGPLPFTLLARAIASASPSSYHAAKQAVAEIASSGSSLTRLMLAYVMPREKLAEGHQGWGATEERSSSEVLAYALAFAADAKCVVAVAEYESAWEAYAELSNGSDRIVKELGAERALPILRQIMLTASSWGEGMTHHAEALVQLEASPAVARVSVEMLENHHAGAVLRPWLSKRPALAIPALAEQLAACLAGKRQRPHAAASLLSSLVLAHRELALAAQCNPAGRVVTDHVLETTKPLPDASPAELPPALASPPWRSSKGAKTDAVTFPKLEPLPFEEHVHWGDDDPRVLADEAFPPYDEPRSATRDATVLRELKDEKRDWVSIFQVGQLTDGAALELLEEWGPETFYFDASDVEGIVARFGLSALPLALRYASAKADTVLGLSRVESPRVAPLMAHAAIDLKKSREVGERWLARFPEAAAVGLVPELGARTGKERATIEAALRLAARAAPDVVTSVAKRYGVGQPVAAVLASSSFAKVPKKLPKMPEFWNAAGLPRPKLARVDHALPLAAVEDLGTYLALSKREDYHPALFDVRASCDPASLARFAWALFSEWLGAGAPTKHDFGFFVLGVFGDDDAARALQPMIKAWAPGGFPQRAQMGVDVLAALGTHAALEQVYKTATKVRSKALAAHAEKTLEKIASRLGLSREDLADRLVPDLDVDERGTRTFDYGKRRFVVRFDEHLKPYVDLSGKRVADLPAPVATDDEELAEEARAAFKELKKRAREVMAEQTKRLEQSLVTRRKYAPRTFTERFVDHALLRMLATRLLWGAYGKGLRAAFRIEDGAFMDVEGRPFELRDGESVGLVHPAELDDKARAAWGDVLAEHRIIQPIEQLGRPVMVLDDTLLASTEGKTVPSTTLLGLERKMWKRGASPQGGVYGSYEKTMGDIVAVLAFEPGVYLGDPTMNPTQTLSRVGLLRGKNAARIGDLDVAVASELASDVSALLA